MVYSTHLGYDEPEYDANNPILRDGQPEAEAVYLTDAFTREALAFVDRERDKPFFLYLAYNAVHSPLQGANASVKKFAHIDDVHRRVFAAMLSSLDDGVGASGPQYRGARGRLETFAAPPRHRRRRLGALRRGP